MGFHHRRMHPTRTSPTNVGLRGLVAAVLGLTAATSSIQAQTGLLVVAHGSDSTWNGAVRATVSQVTWQGPVATAFLMGPEAESAGWDAAVRLLVSGGATRIVVVPLLVSSHGAHYRQIQHYAGVLPVMPGALASHDHRENPAARQAVPMVVAGATIAS